MIVCKIGELRIKAGTPGDTSVAVLNSAHNHVAYVKDARSYLRMACYDSTREGAASTILERLRGLISATEHGKEVVKLLEVRFDYTPVYAGGLFDEDFLEINLAFHPLVTA
jgi:hypothetical protein